MKKLAFALTIIFVDAQDHSRVSANVLSLSGIEFNAPDKILEAASDSVESRSFDSVIYNEKVFVRFRSSGRNGYRVRIRAKNCAPGSWKFSHNSADYDIPFFLYCDHNRVGSEMPMTEGMNFSAPSGMQVSNPDLLFDLPKQSVEKYFYTLFVLVSPGAILRSPSGEYSCVVSVELFDY